MKFSLKRRVLPLLLVVIMLALSIGPISVLGSDPATLTVNFTPAVPTGQTRVINLYQVFSFDSSGYLLNSEFTDFEGYPDSTTQRLEDYLRRDPELTSTEMRTLVANLIEFVGDGTGFTKVTQTAAAGATSVAFEDVDAGYYFVTGQSGTGATATLVGALALKNIRDDDTSVDLSLKIAWEVPVYSKMVSRDFENWGKSTNASVNDWVHYRLFSEVPDTSGFDLEEYVFTMTDAFTNQGGTGGSEFVTLNAIYVFVGDKSDPEFYQWTSTSNIPRMLYNALEPFELLKTYWTHEVTSWGFKVTFHEDFFEDFSVGDDLVVTYDLNLHSTAVGEVDPWEANPGAWNETVLEYSTTPDSDILGELWDETEVATFDVTIKKFFYQGTIEMPLEGVQFTLLRGTSASRPATFDDNTAHIAVFMPLRIADNDADSNVYRLGRFIPPDGGNMSSTEPTLMVVTPESGLIVLRGLGEGTYTLYERNTVTGYNEYLGPITFTLGSDGSLSSYQGPYMTSPSTDGDIVKVENRPTSLFPETGGVGRTMLYVGGGVLFAGAGVTLIFRGKKKDKSEDLVD